MEYQELEDAMSRLSVDLKYDKKEKFPNTNTWLWSCCRCERNNDGDLTGTTYGICPGCVMEEANDEEHERCRDCKVYWLDRHGRIEAIPGDSYDPYGGSTTEFNDDYFEIDMGVMRELARRIQEDKENARTENADDEYGYPLKRMPKRKASSATTLPASDEVDKVKKVKKAKKANKVNAAASEAIDGAE